MHIDTNKNIELNQVWELIISKLGSDGNKVCPNTSGFYKTQDGIECSLRKRNGDLIYICYREDNRSSGYRWTIKKI